MSSETKWTRGPWLYGEDGFSLGNGVVYVRPAGGGLRDVATVRGYGDEQKANTALIASAPKLYEALYQVLTVANLRDHPAIAEMARTALASARGES